ncbi:MAG: NAD(P)/FAD-dependent oxidoreductase [Prochlorotrichaceae cyanobacterium]
MCILGGGFGGLYTALRLGQFPWEEIGQPEITLVDRNDRFVFLPLLYELVTGEMADWEIAPRFAELLKETTVRFCQGTVEQIDLEQQCVTLGSGEKISWDRLVLALGGETPLEGVPGAADYAIPFRSVEDAYRLKAKFQALEQARAQTPELKIRVAIVGGGYSGVELACKVADRLGERGRVRIIEQSDQVLRFSTTFNQEAAQQALADRGVWIDLETTVQEVGADFLDLVYREQVDRIPVDVVLWTIGNRVVPVVQSLALPRNDRGQIRTEPTLQVQNHDQIYALGDLAEGRDASGQTIPKTAQGAFQQADYVAWNLWASLQQAQGNDRPLLPFRYQHLGEMLALGEDRAALSGLGLQLDGPLAYLIRRLVYLQRMPTWEHQIKVGLSWLTRPFMG